jgi:ABC-type Fe3+ transport system substrate-binding protein
MNSLRLRAVSLAAAGLITACGGTAAPSAGSPATSPSAASPSAAAASSAAKPSPAAPSTGSAAPAGAEDWNAVIAAAKKEGEVIVWSTSSDPRRKFLTEGFNKAYPDIKVNLFMAPSTSERDTRFINEYKAGVAKVDIIVSGGGNMNQALKPQGMLQPARNMLRPELFDTKLWRGGKLNWGDEEEKYLLMADSTTSPMATLNSSVDENEVQSWDDLLKDKFKGKIVMIDPRIAGGGWAAGIFMYFVQGLGEDYMKKLFDHRVVLSSDERTNAEWTDSGKMLVDVWAQAVQISQLEKLGSKVKPVHVLKTAGKPLGAFLSNETGVGFPNLNPLPHPNAARVYADWLYSKDGQQAMVDLETIGSLRMDVDVSKMPSYSVIEPGIESVYTNPWTAPEPTKKMRDFFTTVYRTP